MFGAFGRPVVRSSTLGNPPVAAPQPDHRLDWLSVGQETPAPGAPRKGSYLGLSILDRYLVRELLAPFGFAIAAFTLFMLINSLFLAAEYVINKGVPAGLIARYLVLQLSLIHI